jgi:alanine racemase
MNACPPEELTWCEISRSALEHNARLLKRRVGDARLGVVVKADAYGHGLVLASRAFLAGGADWLIVNGLNEAITLRRAGIEAPIYLVGRLPPWAAHQAVAADIRVICYDFELASALSDAARNLGTVARIHMKIETGNHRQGLVLEEAIALARAIRDRGGPLEIEGLSTHYADIEDTTDHRFALSQLARFEEAIGSFRAEGFAVPITNTANSAATILWPRTHGTLVRAGIAAYGLWPSTETYAAALALPEQRDGRGGFLPDLAPALSWRARLSQVKSVPAGAWIGYGRTYRCTHESLIAVIPVGYHEGYDRRLSNLGHALVEGGRAPIRGRVCMNMAMIDVTDQRAASAGDVVTLIGVDGEERISAEDLGRWCATINYEIVSRIHPSVPRIPVA